MTSPKSPLRVKMQTNGVPRLQGVFTLRDQEGFPIDMSYELARENGWQIDWVEAMADAARQCVFKYESLVKEVEMLDPQSLHAAQFVFMSGIMSSPGETFCARAQAMHAQIWRDEI